MGAGAAAVDVYKQPEKKCDGPGVHNVDSDLVEAAMPVDGFSDFLVSEGFNLLQQQRMIYCLGCCGFPAKQQVSLNEPLDRFATSFDFWCCDYCRYHPKNRRNGHHYANCTCGESLPDNYPGCHLGAYVQRYFVWKFGT